MSTLTILSVSYDRELGELRAALLKNAGHVVVSCYSIECADKYLPARPDVMLIGHTIPTRECDQLMNMCRELSSQTAIIHMVRYGLSKCEVKPDLTVEALAGPESLLDSLQEAVTKKRAEKS
jgi:DNA-binding NtrC family response regulator